MRPYSHRRAYTLIEIIISVALMMMLMLVVTQLFSLIGGSIANTSSVLNTLSDLRNAKNRLEKDLSLMTADPNEAPPVKIGTNKGYFCLIEGMGAAYSNGQLQSNGYVRTSEIALNADSTDNAYDNTVGDTDDIVMFTATAPVGEPFRGRCGSLGIIESSTAEIAWFVRGTTLYRRVLLIIPDSLLQQELGKYALNMQKGEGFYSEFDISAHPVFDASGNPTGMVANTLDDLTIRENRFGHWTGPPTPGTVKDGIHINSAVYFLRLPTLAECAFLDPPTSPTRTWNAGLSFTANMIALGFTTPPTNTSDTTPALNYSPVPPSPTPPDSSSYPQTITPPVPFIDFWLKPLPWNEVNQKTGDLDLLGNSLPLDRTGEDVILKNVLSFDVQVWEETLNRYINLGEFGSAFFFQGQGRYNLLRNLLPTQGLLPCVYDTWTDFYEIGRPGMNQIDDPGRSGPPDGIIDNITEWECPPPYSEPLRGIKVSIRVFDPDSKTVREMTLIHSFAK
ncbi:MAG: PulJ/GspJ family protein [Thermoguttaceae bacterium]